MFWQNIIVVGICVRTGATVQVRTQEEGEFTYIWTTAQCNGLLVWVHELLDTTLPVVSFDLLCVFESEEPILAVPKESMSRIPSLSTVTSEFVTMLVLAYENGVFIFPTAIIKCKQTAAIFVNSEYTFPVIIPAIGRQLPAKGTNLVCWQNSRFLGQVRSIVFYLLLLNYWGTSIIFCFGSRLHGRVALTQ